MHNSTRSENFGESSGRTEEKNQQNDSNFAYDCNVRLDWTCIIQ